MQKNKGILLVLSGFSGSGKGTVMKEIMKKYSDRYALSISATTRAPRPGETDGVEYFFKTRAEFEAMIENDELVEYAQYVSNYYGTPKAYVEEQLNAGKDVILEIEIQGALKIKEKFRYVSYRVSMKLRKATHHLIPLSTLSLVIFPIKIPQKRHLN